MKRAGLEQALLARRTFFELMRRVEQIERGRGNIAPAKRRSPSWLRIEQAAHMHFAATEVERVEIEQTRFVEHDAPPQVRIVQRHFGLFAPYGPLPLSVTEHAMRERRFERNEAFERFLNVVCADLAWLHYQAWAAMHPTLSAERAVSPFAARVTALARAQTDAGSDARACRHTFPGLYCAPRRSLADLQRMLTRYFDVPLRVVPRHGRWIAVPQASHGPQHLGAWRLGKRVWDAQHSMEIVIGPIDADDFYRWCRRADAPTALRAVATDFVDGALSPVIKVQVRTRPDLAGRIGRMRLGVDAWSRPGHALRTLTLYESSRG